MAKSDGTLGDRFCGWGTTVVLLFSGYPLTAPGVRLRGMRIAFCITTIDVGGAERAMTRLAEQLASQGCQVRVFVLGRRPESASAELAARLEAAAIPTTYFNARRPWQAVSVARRLARELRTFAPDIVQTFLHHANVLGSWAARRAGISHVVTGIRVAERRRNTHRWLTRRIDHLVSRHVCVSHDVANFAREVIGLPAAKLVVIHNGVEIVADEPRPALPIDLELPADRSMLVYAGRLDPQKRLDWMLAQMPAVFAQLPGHDLLIVGKGPQASALRRAAIRHSIADRVHFAGWRHDTQRILSAADVVLLTSAWEGLPNVLLEAMACGRPVVCTRAEGIAEALGPSASMQLVATDHAADFVQAIVRIAADPELQADLGRMNRELVSVNFRIDTMVRKYLELYRDILESH